MFKFSQVKRLGIWALVLGSTTSAFGFSITITTNPSAREVTTTTKINASGSWTLGANDPAVTAVECYFLHGNEHPPMFPGAAVTGTITDQKTAYITGTNYSLTKNGHPDRRLTATKNGAALNTYYVSAVPFGPTFWYQDAAGKSHVASNSPYTFP